MVVFYITINHPNFKWHTDYRLKGYVILFDRFLRTLILRVFEISLFSTSYNSYESETSTAKKNTLSPCVTNVPPWNFSLLNTCRERHCSWLVRDQWWQLPSIAKTNVVAKSQKRFHVFGGNFRVSWGRSYFSRIFLPRF